MAGLLASMGAGVANKAVSAAFDAARAAQNQAYTQANMRLGQELQQKTMLYGQGLQHQTMAYGQGLQHSTMDYGNELSLNNAQRMIGAKVQGMKDAGVNPMVSMAAQGAGHVPAVQQAGQGRRDNRPRTNPYSTAARVLDRYMKSGKTTMRQRANTAMLLLK